MTVDFISEPELEFGAAKHIDIRFGLMNYGPFDYASRLAPKEIRLGFVGTPQTIHGVESWLNKCKNGIAAKASNQPQLFAYYDSYDTVVEVLDPLVSPDVLGNVEPVLRTLAESQSAGWLLVIGLLGALWSASGYVGAFGRAMNRIYEIGEGRPVWKLRPQQLLITLVCIILLALALVMLAVSGPVAESIGDVVGLGDTAVQVWGIAKWPVLALVAILVVALLYYSTPNVQQPKFRWMSVGAAVALLIAVVAAVAFSFYVANFASYNKTYGSLAGVIIGLLFLWIMNLALLFGAELDSELERGRQLQAGMPAEVELQLPARDTRNIEKAQEKEAKDIAMGRRIREESGEVWPPLPPLDQDDPSHSHHPRQTTTKETP